MVGPVFVRETNDFAGRFNELLMHNQETAVTAATRLEVSPAVITKWRQGKSIPSGEENCRNVSCIGGLFAWRDRYTYPPYIR